MRRLMTVALSLCVVGSAAAQSSEIIIRRPGVPDRVIKLDSASVREDVAKIEGQIRELTATMKQRSGDLSNELQLQRNGVKLDLDQLRSKTLALKESAGAQQDILGPLMKGFAIAMRRQPHLGVQINIEPRESDKFGAYINAVTPGSPAEKAGILSGDIIVRLAGKSVIDKDPKGEPNPGLHLISLIATLPVGKPVDVELRRGTQTVNLKITPTEDNSTMMSRTAPSVAEISRLPVDRITEAPGFGRVVAAPAVSQFNVFGNGNGTFNYSFSTNGLFSNVELTSLNEKLGAYFGTTEGVLVVNVGAPREMLTLAPMMTTGRGGVGAVAGGRGSDSFKVMVRNGVGTAAPRDVVMSKIQADSAYAQRAGAAARAGIAANMVCDSAIRSGSSTINCRSGRTDLNQTYIDGVPVQAGVRRMAPVNIGLEPGDVILSVDGRKVSSPSQLMRIVGSYDHNDEFKLQIVRQKHPETLTVKMP